MKTTLAQTALMATTTRGQPPAPHLPCRRCLAIAASKRFAQGQQQTAAPTPPSCCRRFCHTQPSAPTIEVEYPCEEGSTALSKVRVANRRGYFERLLSFTMDFLNATRGKDKPSYQFKEARETFLIDVQGGRAGNTATTPLSSLLPRRCCSHRLP